MNSLLRYAAVSLIPLLFSQCGSSNGGGDPADITAPSIINKRPQEGAQDVARRPVISVTCDEPLDEASVGDASCRLYLDATSTLVGTTVTLTEPIFVEMRPIADLQPETTYRVELGELTDISGNVMPEVLWTFTTSAWPTIQSRGPVADEFGVRQDTQVFVVFDRLMDGETVTQDSFHLTVGGVRVAAYLIAGLDQKTFSLSPAAHLQPASLHTVTLANTINDEAGNEFSGATWDFTTSLDPTVAITHPTSGLLTSREFGLLGKAGGGSGTIADLLLGGTQVMTQNGFADWYSVVTATNGKQTFDFTISDANGYQKSVSIPSDLAFDENLLMPQEIGLDGSGELIIRNWNGRTFGFAVVGGSQLRNIAYSGSWPFKATFDRASNLVYGFIRKAFPTIAMVELDLATGIQRQIGAEITLPNSGYVTDVAVLPGADTLAFTWQGGEVWLQTRNISDGLQVLNTTLGNGAVSNTLMANEAKPGGAFVYYDRPSGNHGLVSVDPHTHVEQRRTPFSSKLTHGAMSANKPDTLYFVGGASSSFGRLTYPLQRIDLGTGTIDTIADGTGSVQWVHVSGLVVDQSGTSAYLLSSYGSRIVTVDLNSMTPSVLVEGRVGSGTHMEGVREAAVNWTAGEAYVLDYRNWLFAIDLATGSRRVVSSSWGSTSPAHQLVYDPTTNAVFVIAGNEIWQIDAVSGVGSRIYKKNSLSMYMYDFRLDESSGDVFISGYENVGGASTNHAFVERIDSATGSVTELYSQTRGSGPFKIPFIYDLCYDSVSDRVYMLVYDRPGTGVRQVAEIETSTGNWNWVTGITATIDYYSIVMDPMRRRLNLGSYRGAHTYDLASGQYETTNFTGGGAVWGNMNPGRIWSSPTDQRIVFAALGSWQALVIGQRGVTGSTLISR